MPADSLPRRYATELSLREIGVRDRIRDDNIDRLVPRHERQLVCDVHVDHVYFQVCGKRATLNLPGGGGRRRSYLLIEDNKTPGSEDGGRQVDPSVRRHIVDAHPVHEQVLEG